MKNKLFGRGVFNRTSKVSNMTPDRLAGGGFTFFEHMSTTIRGGGVLLVVLALCTLLGTFSTHAGAQELPAVELGPFYDIGAFDNDGITTIRPTGGVNPVFTLCTPWSGGNSSSVYQLEITNPAGDTTTHSDSDRTASSSSTCSISSRPSFQIQGLFGLQSNRVAIEGVYKVRGRASSTAEWGPYAYIVVDATDPTLSVFVSAADGTTQRTAAANAYDLGGGVYKFEVVNGHTGTCDATGTANATFADYEVTELTVSANTEACFRATDFSGNVVYGSTNGATVGTTDPPAGLTISHFFSVASDTFYEDIDFRNNNDLPVSNDTGFARIRLAFLNSALLNPDQVYLTKPDRTRTRTGLIRDAGESFPVRSSALSQEGIYTISATSLYNFTTAADSNVESPRIPARFLIDRTAPVIDILTSSTTASEARTVIATATDALDEVTKFEVADSVIKANCDSTGASFGDYDGLSRDVEANTQDCFRATDRAGNVRYMSTEDAEQGLFFSTQPAWDGSKAAFNGVQGLLITSGASFAAQSLSPGLFFSSSDSSGAFIPAVATGSGTISYAKGFTTDGSDPSASCNDASTYTYNLGDAVTAAEAWNASGKVRICAKVTDGTTTAYSNPTAVLTVDLTPQALVPSGDIWNQHSFNADTGFSDEDRITSYNGPVIYQTVTPRLRDHGFDLNEVTYLTKPDGTVSRLVSRDNAGQRVHFLASEISQEGTYEARLAQLSPDADGTESTPSAPFIFTIDRSAPIITIVNTSGSGTGARTVIATATDAIDQVHSIEVANGVTKANCDSTASFEDYDDSPRDVEANTEDCFKATDRAGNIAYASTEDAIAGGIASITYKNSDNTAAATGNLLKSRTFTVEGTTTASTEYRIFVRAKDGTWPGTATASGSSAANGSVTQSITLNADGDYELATQIKVGSEYLPETLAVNSEFTIDTTAPAINNPALVSDNSNDTSLAMEGDDLTLTFTVSETLTSAPSVTIAGQTVTATESSGTYTATVTVSSSTDEGAVTYDIGVLTDTAGNTFNHTETTSSVIVDLIAPTLTIVQTAGTGTAERTVTAFASDTNGVTGLEVADDESTCSHLATNTFGNYTQNTPRTVQATTQDCFKATDNAGNVRYTSTLNAITGVGGITYTHSDNTAAATGNLLKTSTFTIAGTTATTTNYRLFVRAKDSSWPATATASGTSAANGTLSQTLTRTDGDYETAFQIQVGNSFVPALASLVATSTFSIDSSPPTFTLNYSGSPTIVNNTGYYNTSTLSTGGVTVSNITETALATAVLTLARTDTTGIPNLTPTPTVNTDTNTVSFANLIVVANGTYTATVTLTDDAGNQTTKTLTLVVDTATPSITAVTIDTPSARRSVEALITVTHGQTFQETLTATLSGQNCTTLNPITLTGSTTSTTAIQLRGRTGTFTCTITLTDQAGNTSSSFTIPSFTIKRSSSGGGGGVRPGSRVEAPSFNVPVASVTPTQPTDRQERIALLKLALNRILERIQYLLAQKTNG